MDKQEIKKKIENYEYYQFTVGNKLCGRDVEVRNLKVGKGKAVADIILHDYDDNYQERHDKCEYDLDFLMQ